MQELSKLTRWVMGHEALFFCDNGWHRSAGTCAALMVLAGGGAEEVAMQGSGWGTCIHLRA